jgi:chromosome segregation ATPase
LVASAGTAIPAYIAAAKAVKTLATEVKKAFESAESSREELQTALEKLAKDEEKAKSTVSAADSALKDYNQKLTNARKSADELAGKLDEALEASEKNKLGDTRDREAAIDKMIKKIIELNEARGQGEGYADKAGALIKAAKGDSKMDLKTLKSYADKAQAALNVVKEIATYASQLV